MQRAKKVVIAILFAPPVIIAVAFSSGHFLWTFVSISCVTYFVGKSRLVTDPVAGIAVPTRLTIQDFHQWAVTVCTSDRYKADYQRFITDTNRGLDEKLPLLMSQIKAINYYKATTILTVFLAAINAYLLYDLFYSDTTFSAPIATGSLIGILYGYSCGLYSLTKAYS